MKKLYSRKCTCKEPDEKLTFPCLMESKKSNGNIYLITGVSICDDYCFTGTIVSANGYSDLGEHHTEYSSDLLIPYHGTVTLSME